MIIKSSAPTRLSLFGGGTDVGEYREKYGGLCLNLAIDIKQEFVFNTQSKIKDIPLGATPKFYKAFMDHMEIEEIGFTQTFDGQITGGIGSSASAAVAFLSGLIKAKGSYLSRSVLAEIAWDIEVNKLGLFGGKQDQYAAAYGGLNAIVFPPGKSEVIVTTIDKDYADSLRPYLFLIYSGSNRKSSNIQDNFKTCKSKEALDKIKEMVLYGIEAIGKKDFEKVGSLLNDSWELKKQSNQVSNPQIDSLYDKALKAGAWGGKVCGAGQGGYMLFMAPPEKHRDLKESLGNQVDFNIDFNGVQTRII